MDRKVKLSTAITACVVAASVAVGGTALYIVQCFGGSDIYQQAAKYAVVRQVIEDTYVGETDSQEIADAAAKAMVTALGDRWSYYMTAEEYESYKQYGANQYTGIGVTVSIDEDGYVLIKTVTEDSPAYRAGIVAGDKILALDGTDVAGMTLSQVKGAIAEKLGQPMEVKLRGEDGAERTVSVTGEYIYKDPVSFRLLENGVGYIKITNFEDGSGDGAVSAVEELLSRGAEALVFDVRSNPGGKVSQMLKILDRLLPEGELFISVSRDGEETVDTSDANCVDVPMAVLINSNSYSAAEFFAAALSEYGAAETVGLPTTGKGRSQVTVALSDGSAVHLSKYKYLTPNRVDLSEQGGLTPDVEVALSDEKAAMLAAGALEMDKDDQLQAALKLLDAK